MSSTSYSFLPVVRRGLAGQITGPASGQRATVTVSLTLSGEKIKSDSDPEGGKDVITFPQEPQVKQVQLYGPGDILGFDPRIIVRTDPRPNSGDFEQNYFPAIEFADPDFAWRFTPTKGDPRGLLPWISLIVLAADQKEGQGPEFKDGDRSEKNLPPFIIVEDISFLPDLLKAWQWAHVQVTHKATGIDQPKSAAELLNADPGHAVCRLLCPRRLQSRRHYAAFVVPTFKLGLLAGRDELTPEIADTIPPPTIDNNGCLTWDVAALAWDIASKEQPRIPYYYRWEFSTSEKGDFEYLLSLLEPRFLPGLGLRPMDVENPGFGVAGVDRAGLDLPESHYLDLEGALKSVDAAYTPWGQDAEKVEALQTNLSDLINSPIAQLEPGLEIHRTSAIQGTPHGEIQPPIPPQPDGQYLWYENPWVTPPIYGRWHAAKKTSSGKVVDTNSTAWIDTLNLDPRHRVAAGLGAEVVRKNQEDLMASAWEQLGTFEQANQLLRNAQLGREVSTCLYQRISTLLYDSKNPGNFLRLTTPLFGKILYQPNEGATASQVSEKQTVAKKLSQAYPARIDPSLRHVLRQRGPMRRRQKSQMRRHIKISGVLPEQTRASDDSSSEFSLNAEDVICSSITPMGTLDGDLVLSYWGQSVQESVQGKESQPQVEGVVSTIANSIFKIIEPSVTIKEHVKSRLKLSDALAIRFLDGYPGDPLDPIMAAPEFTQAMYEPLRDLSHELLLPGVERIPANTIGLLKVNRRFMESYLCGLNHEFAGELVWRGYPTDQRGSYFRQFWNVSEYLPDSAMHTTALNLWLQNHSLVSIADIPPLEKEGILRRHPEAANNIEQAVQIEADEEYLKDIQQLHEWKNKSTGEYKLLGENAVRKEEELVLVIRGDLLRRYPSALIYAVDATDAVDEENRKILAPKLPEFTNQSGARVFPIFRASLPPDLTFFGFPFTLEEACGGPEHGHGKFFVFEERVGEPRFGLDEPSEKSEVAKQPGTWDDLTWEDFSTLKDEKFVDIEYGDYVDNVKNPPTENDKKEWATSSATRAWITMQKPIRRAAHAKQMLPRPCIEGIEPNHGQRGEVLIATINGQQLTDVTSVTIPGGVEAHVLSGGNDKQLPVELDIAWWVWPREQEVTVSSRSGALQSRRPVKFYIRDNPPLKIRMEIQNDFEITLFLEEKAPYFLERLTNLDRYSLLSSKALAASEFDQRPIGTGPFIFKSRRPRDSIQLVRNEKYWGDKAYPDDIYFKFTRDQAQLEDMMFDNQLDMCATNDRSFILRAQTKMNKYRVVPVNSFFRATGLSLIYRSELSGNFMGPFGPHLEYVRGVPQLRFGMLFEPLHLDPHLINDPFSLMIAAQMLEGLTGFRSGNSNIGPYLAEILTHLPNQLSYTIKIRQGVTFHDGSVLTAQIVADNLTR